LAPAHLSPEVAKRLSKSRDVSRVVGAAEVPGRSISHSRVVRGSRVAVRRPPVGWRPFRSIPPRGRSRRGRCLRRAPRSRLLLEIERANGRWPPTCARSRSDDAAPLIGSSLAIRAVRDRIQRVAGTAFTVLIEGASGPQPHPSFIEVFDRAALGVGHGTMARAGEDGPVMTAKLLRASIRDTESQLVPYAGEAECDIGKPLAT